MKLLAWCTVRAAWRVGASSSREGGGRDGREWCVVSRAGRESIARNLEIPRNSTSLDESVPSNQPRSGDRHTRHAQSFLLSLQKYFKSIIEKEWRISPECEARRNRSRDQHGKREPLLLAKEHVRARGPPLLLEGDIVAACARVLVSLEVVQRPVVHHTVRGTYGTPGLVRLRRTYSSASPGQAALRLWCVQYRGSGS